MLPTVSQNISNKEIRVRQIINNGDTLIQFKLSDAKSVLSDLLDKSIVDSLLSVYTLRDSLNTNIITLNTKEIADLKLKCSNKDIQIANLMKVYENDSTKFALKDDIIKQQKKEIRRQKTYKVIALIGDVALPLFVILLLYH